MYYWRKINFILTVLLILFLIPSVYSLSLPGFISTDDGTWMVVRFSAFFDSLKDGQIPVRVLERLNNGYGYPVANFLYPGFMYVASVFHILGLGFVDSIKAVLIGSIALSGFFTFFWLKRLFDPVASFVGTLFYIYTPYHLYDIYKRGSVGEILAFAWIPLILWQIERKNLPLSAIGIFFLIISHNSLALLTLPFIFIYALVQKRLLLFIVSSVLGIFMSSFFIIPALYELSLTKFSTVSISNPIEYFAEIKLIGYSTFSVFLFLIFILIYQRKSLKLLSNKLLLSFIVLVFIVSIILSSSISRYLWEIVSSQFIQFPFRILSLTTISTAFLSAFIISKIRGTFQIVLSFILILILGVSAYPFLTPKERTNYPDEYYTTNMDSTTVKNEYLPVWVKTNPLSMPKNKAEISSGSGDVEITNINSRRVDLNLNNLSNAVVRLNYIYYPGWKAYMNNEKLKIDYSNDYGVMDVKVERSIGKLTYIFEETPIRYVSNILTLLAIFATILLLIKPILKFK